MIRPFGGSGLLHVKTTLTITPMLVGLLLLKLQGAEGTVIRLIVHSQVRRKQIESGEAISG